MNPILRRLPIFLLSAMLFAAGCATLPGGGDPAAAQMADELFRDGDLAAAAEAYLDAAQASRRNRDHYLLRAAEAWRENGDADNARAALAGIDARRLSAESALRLSLLRAELALDAGDPAQAVRQLQFDPATVAPAWRARFHELRGRAAEANGDPLGAALAYARLDALLDSHERRDNNRRLRGLLDGLDDATLQQVAAGIDDENPLRRFLARALSARGLAVPDNLARGGESRPSALTLGLGQRIALLLPTSGPFSSAAAAVRDGFLAARFQSGDGAPDVFLVDAGETPESAIAGYRQALAQGAAQVVGPLSREAVTALFAERDLPAPVLALNRPAGPLPPGHMSFALAPEDEAAAAARLLAQRDLRRVLAVAAPEELAQRSLDAFRSRHQQAGGEVMATVILPVSGVDYQPQIRAALAAAGLPTSAPIDLTIPHDPGFDAVFMAVRPQQSRLLVPQLKLFGLTGMPMLGTSMLHALDDGSRLDRDLDGIEFAELPWVVADLPGLPARSALQGQLDSANGSAARLFAFGIDAWRLLSARHALVDADLPLAGATGDLSMDAFGEVRSQPVIARFRNGQARPLETGGLRPD